MPAEFRSPSVLTDDTGDQTEAQAAKLLRVSEKTLRRWRKAGRIGHYLMPGGRVRYSLQQLQLFREACRVDADVRTSPRLTEQG